MHIWCVLCNSLSDGILPSYSTLREAREHARVHFCQLELISDEMTEDDIFKRCFPKPLRAAAKANSAGSCRRSVAKYCRISLKKRQETSSRIPCNLCGFGVIARLMCDSKVGFTLSTDGPIEHAYTHLGRQLFKCRYCDQAFNAKRSVIGHLIMQGHVVAPNRPTVKDYKDESEKYQDEILNTIKRCFDGTKQESPLLNDIWENRRAITDFCRSLIGKHPKASHTTCNLCGREVYMMIHGTQFRAGLLIDHACAHFGKELFACRQCGMSRTSERGALDHVRRVHGNQSTKADVVDNSREHRDEILATLKSCFSRTEQPPPKKETSNRLQSEASVRGKMGSKLMAERQILCNRLIRKAIDKDGKIRCHLCSKRIPAKRPGGLIVTKAMQHMYYHLRKPVYHCKLCPKTDITHSRMSLHLKEKHALGMGNNHDLCADEYHSEISGMLSQCYEGSA